MRKNSKRSSNFFLIWSIVFLVFVILGIFSYSILKESTKKERINQEIETLKQEAEKIEKENMALDERISYLSSKDYREIQVKDKFNLQSPDENLIIVNQAPKKDEDTNVSDKTNKVVQETEKISNPKKWWKFFFK